MKSSKPLYAILGVCVPLSVLALWAPLSGMILGHFAAAGPSPVFLGEIWLLCGFLSALAASCYAGIMKKSASGRGAADFRGSVVAAAAAYAVLSFLRRDVPPSAPLSGRFLPSVDSAAAALAAVFAWFSVLSLRGIFSGLELFESFAAENRGERLRELMREYAPEMSQTDERLKSLMRGYGIEFILPCLAMNVSAFSGEKNAAFLFWPAFLSPILFCAGFLLLGFLGLLRRELACASEGVSLSVRDRSRPLPFMALGIGGAAILALAGSSDASLLPPGIILAFFAWLGRALSFLFPPAAGTEPAFQERKFAPLPASPGNLPPELEEAVPWPGWEWVKLGAIAAAALLFFLFMVYPLLRGSGFSLKAGRIRAAVIRWFGDLAKGLSVFFSALRDRGSSLAIRKLDEDKLRRIASELLSGIKRKEAKRSVNLFARLILWGIETAGVPWKPSLAPGEYCGLLAAALRAAAAAEGSAEDPAAFSGGPRSPGGGWEIPEAALRCGELFEKALYSGRPLSAGDERDFKNLVRRVTGETAPVGTTAAGTTAGEASAGGV